MADSWSRRDTASLIEDVVSKVWKMALVAEINGELAGFVWGYKASCKRGSLESLDTLFMGDVPIVTAPGFRDIGIATTLETTLLSEAAKNGMEYAWVCPYETYKPVVSLYEKRGFRIDRGAWTDDRKEGMYPVRLRMLKPLNMYGP